MLVKESATRRRFTALGTVAAEDREVPKDTDSPRTRVEKSARGGYRCLSMKRIADFLFEGHMLKHLQRTGYAYLGVGRESVAEHTFMTAFIAWVLSRCVPEADTERLLAMCLVHDLPESRIGDLNNVQKRYVTADESAAAADAAEGLPFGGDLKALIDEFNEGKTLVSRLARDADRLSLIIDLKALSDRGYRTPEKWQPHVLDRLLTQQAKDLADAIIRRDFDGWWMEERQEYRHKVED